MLLFRSSSSYFDPNVIRNIIQSEFKRIVQLVSIVRLQVTKVWAHILKRSHRSHIFCFKKAPDLHRYNLKHFAVHVEYWCQILGQQEKLQIPSEDMSKHVTASI